MKKREGQREAAIERMADHVLTEGLGGATLRPLAAAAGTSDRMLLYYFNDKDEILSATLHRIAERMVAVLDQAVPAGEPRPFGVLLEEVWPVLASNSLQPYMPLWLELASGAARGVEPHLGIASQIAGGFLSWVSSRLRAERGVDHAAATALFLTMIEGMYLVQSIGRPDIAATAAKELISRLPQPGGSATRRTLKAATAGRKH